MRRRWTELERRCRRDGTTWYVQPDTLRPSWPVRWFLQRPGWSRRRAAHEAYRANVDARRAAAATCPACGSTSYDERKVCS